MTLIATKKSQYAYPDLFSIYLQSENGKKDLFISHGFLSYSVLPEGDIQQRNILLVDDHNYTLQRLLDQKRVEHFHDFKRAIRAEIHHGQNRLVAYKKVACQILDDYYKDNRTAVAVYKFGAVPIFLTPHKVIVEYLEKTIDVQIGILPRFSRKDYEVKNPFLVFEERKETNKLVQSTFFRDSLLFNLSIYFRKYFEDIGLLLQRIQQDGRVERVLAEAKRIENILASSIQTKLRALRDDIKLNQEQKNIRFISDTTRCFVLCLLNDLYKFYGINDRPKYKHDVAKALNNNFLRPETMTTDQQFMLWVFQNHKDYKVLSDPASANFDLDSMPAWVQQIWQFALFLLGIGESLKRQDISYPIEYGLVYVPESDQSTEALVMGLSPNKRVKVLQKKRQNGLSEDYLIWLADVDSRTADASEVEAAWALRIEYLLSGWIGFFSPSIQELTSVVTKDYEKNNSHFELAFYLKSQINGFSNTPRIATKLTTPNATRTIKFGRKIVGKKGVFKLFYTVGKGDAIKYQPNLWYIIKSITPGWDDLDRIQILHRIIDRWMRT
ncbi:MAG: hypothetical protein MRY78_03700 [Saprospiraceae bacterium]|nr:hypothetical protein [Saprospiraceae bacterium]